MFMTRTIKHTPEQLKTTQDNSDRPREAEAKVAGLVFLGPLGHITVNDDMINL